MIFRDVSALHYQPSDESHFASRLFFIILAWLSYVGPNAPLAHACAPAENQQGSATGAIKAWTDAGIPSHQLVLAVPAYGHSFVVPVENALTSNNGGSSSIAMYPAFDKNQHPKGDKWDDGEGVDVCGVQQNNGGTFTFNGLIENSMLFPNGTAAAGIEYLFDECSQTVSPPSLRMVHVLYMILIIITIALHLQQGFSTHDLFR